MNQQESQRKVDLSTMRKVVSHSIAKAHLSSLKDRVLGHLLDAGMFTDAVQIAVEDTFMPNLMQMVTKQMEKTSQDRFILGEVMQSTVTSRIASHSQALDVEKRRIAAVDQA